MKDSWETGVIDERERVRETRYGDGDLRAREGLRPCDPPREEGERGEDRDGEREGEREGERGKETGGDRCTLEAEG